MCLNETYSKVCISKQLSVAFCIQNAPRHGDTLLPLLLSFSLECSIGKIQENQMELELNGIH
jgi:hypothetical protein